jgi:antitoxin (DNA-binding transcriptional repressor) of toxin-antitoxin stability system
MVPIGIRELKNNLSHYVRQVEGGKRISVTAHGRVVAELVPPGTRVATGRKRRTLSRYEQLVADGLIRPALEKGPLFVDDGMTIKLLSGTVQELIDWTREDKWESHDGSGEQ